MLRAMIPCPICERPAAPRADKKAFPFCSPRCKTIDLGQWVDEKYRLPETEGDPFSLADASALTSQEKA
jgi:endogenous inhibitor of DNA gyrase (YacG/DUF329 family)